MGKPLDITGQQYGRLTVIGYAGSDKQHNAQWRCRCECGEIVIVRAFELKRGHTASCGCFSRERTRTRLTSHGGKGTRLYRIWEQMKARCNNQTTKQYKDYGGRGITVCAEWANNFEAFRDWALANGYRDDLTLDRKENDGPYSPDNCRWATRKDQQNNKRNNHMITFKGETRTLTQWAELTGIPRTTLWDRLVRGWSIERALTARSKKRSNP